MKRSRKVLSWSAGVLLALVVLLVVAVATFDWNRAKPFISDKVSQAIGRSFTINGDLTVDWQRDRSGSWLASLLPWPQFTARDIRIANPDWATQPQFAHLDAARFRLSLLALLARRIEVPSMQLVQPSVDLERDKQGRANWSFALPQDTRPSAWRLNLGTVGFDRGLITLDDAATRTRLKATVTPLQAAIPYDQIVAQQTTDAREQAGKTAGTAARNTLAGSGETPDKREAVAHLPVWLGRRRQLSGQPAQGQGQNRRSTGTAGPPPAVPAAGRRAYRGQPCRPGRHADRPTASGRAGRAAVVLRLQHGQAVPAHRHHPARHAALRYRGSPGGGAASRRQPLQLPGFPRPRRWQRPGRRSGVRHRRRTPETERRAAFETAAIRRPGPADRRRLRRRQAATATAHRNLPTSCCRSSRSAPRAGRRWMRT